MFDKFKDAKVNHSYCDKISKVTSCVRDIRFRER